MYRLFYRRETIGDILFIILDSEKKAERNERVGDVASIYSGDELIGINVFNFSNVYHIEKEGMIISPEEKMLEALNKKLAEAGVAPLEKPLDSGFKVGEIIELEEHPLDDKAHIVTASFGEKKLQTVSKMKNIKVGDKIVAALDGCILFDGSIFHSKVIRNIPNDFSIMNIKELGLGDSYDALIVEDMDSGRDYYIH